MTAILRTQRRTSYPALMLFLIVYIGTLAIIVAPDQFRAELPGQTILIETAGTALQGAP